MRTYSLQLLIDPHDLHSLHASRRNIVLARPVSDPQRPNVVWQSFTPQADTVVTWSETYGLYATSMRLLPGASIVPSRTLPDPACEASAYTFAPDGTFHGPYYGGGLLGPNQFCVTNDMPPTRYAALIFGLTQAAIINGLPGRSSPLNAQVVPAAQRALFTPNNMVYLWLQAGVAAGSVLSELPASVTAVNFGRFANVQTLKYDPTHDRFVPHSQVKRGFVFAMPSVTWPGSRECAPTAP